MKRYFCDMCGERIRPSHARNKMKIREWDKSISVYHLCDDCLAKIIDYIDKYEDKRCNKDTEE